MTRITEVFGIAGGEPDTDWGDVVAGQRCPFLNKRCIKVRKSQPEISIGTCSVSYGSKDSTPILICPYRFLERGQIFTDALHLLTLHEPGNELHVVSEISVPGGSVDYFLGSVKDKKVKDFVGIELQTLDTTGTVWPERQRFLRSVGIDAEDVDVNSTKPFGMNWKMTAKTILIQLHHKISTFEGINKHLVLVIQDCLLDYLKREFKFDHLNNARLGDPMQLHAYRFDKTGGGPSYRIDLRERLSTDTAGISTCLGLQADANVDLQQITEQLEKKISPRTLFTLAK